MQKQMPVKELLPLFMDELCRAKFSADTLQQAKILSNQLIQFAYTARITDYSTEFGQQFLAFLYPDSVNCHKAREPHGLRSKRRILHHLDCFALNGTIAHPQQGLEGLTSSDITLLTDFLQWCLQRGYAKKTTEDRFYCVRQFLRHLNSKQRTIADITEGDMSAF
jgi:hypothetical protein